MKKVVSIICIFCLFIVAMDLQAQAEDAFHITYRHQALSSNGTTLAGVLLLTVVNVSGQDVKDVVVWIQGQNNVTFDNRTVFVGDLVEFQQSGVIDQFQVSQEIAHPEVVDERITWTVEYTNPAGERLVTNVVGERLP